MGPSVDPTVDSAVQEWFRSRTRFSEVVPPSDLSGRVDEEVKPHEEKIAQCDQTLARLSDDGEQPCPLADARRKAKKFEKKRTTLGPLLEKALAVMSMPEGNTFVQRVVNVSTWQYHVKCQDCGYE